MSNLREECGVFGIYGKPEGMDLAACVYHGLYALQHRGQESCGIVVNNDGIFSGHKDSGLVNDVFNKDTLEALGDGQIAVGHCRYGTRGTEGRENAQPLTINHIKGTIAIAHNGSLTNAAELRTELELTGSIFHTKSDAELIAYEIIKERLTKPSIEEALCGAMEKIKGAYSLVIMSPRKLLAARDPKGFRPLCIGTLDDSYVVASESCALDSIGAHFLRDVEPGEIIVIEENGLRSIRTHCNNNPKGRCVFEYIYFARPDSIIDGTCVHQARMRAGAFLAQEHPVEADVVIGVPDSGLDAALGYAQESGIPYDIGFLKNKYIGRTFIAPSQKHRENLVRIKLNPIPNVVKGKRVVLIDDSIVRGTTCARIIRLLREAGAKEVHMRVTAPPFIKACYFGTDISNGDYLVAANHTLEEIEKIIGVDSLGFLSLEHAGQLTDSDLGGFCMGCFTGDYPVEPPKETAPRIYERKISEK